MRQTILALSLLSGFISAQQKIFWPPGAPEQLEEPIASVTKAEPLTKVYNIICPTSVTYSRRYCYGTGVQYTVYGTLLHEATMIDGDYTMHFRCLENAKDEEVTVSVGVQDPEIGTYSSVGVYSIAEVSAMTAKVEGEVASTAAAGDEVTLPGSSVTANSPKIIGAASGTRAKGSLVLAVAAVAAFGI